MKRPQVGIIQQQIRRSVVLLMALSFGNGWAIAADSTLMDWLGQYIKVRKSFSTTPDDATSPASLIYESSSSGGSDTAVDVAVKGKIPDFAPRDGWYVNLSPAVEWHKSTLTTNPVNNLSVDAILTGAFYTSPLHDYLGSGMEYKVTRDFVSDNNPNSVSWKAYYYGGLRGIPWPGAKWKSGGGYTYFYYLPFVGLDHHSNQPLEEQQNGHSVQLAGAVSGSFYQAGVDFVVNPFAELLKTQLALVGTLTWRDRFAGDAAIPHSSTLTDWSLTYYFTRDRHIGLGFDFTKGRDPERNFLSETHKSVGLKFQIGAD